MNFVILDYDIGEQRELAGEMGVARHPAFTVLPPDSGPSHASDRKFGPLNEENLREVLDGLVASYGQ
ncbi:MAG: hypothetical protein HOH95_13655 [Dehalococcoidia bacterium]|nr:hypothetical protein [Dehalococcoidia bacterium]